MTIVDKYASSWRQEIKSEKGSGLKRFRPSSDWQIEEFKGTCDCKNESDLPTESFCHKGFPTKLCKSSLRKQPTFGDATTGFPAKWRLRNERRNSILITRHHPDLGSASDCSSRVGNLIQPIRNTTQIWLVTRYQYGISALFLRRHLAGKPVVASPNVNCFLRLV